MKVFSKTKYLESKGKEEFSLAIDYLDGKEIDEMNPINEEIYTFKDRMYRCYLVHKDWIEEVDYGFVEKSEKTRKN